MSHRSVSAVLSPAEWSDVTVHDNIKPIEVVPPRSMKHQSAAWVGRTIRRSTIDIG